MPHPNIHNQPGASTPPEVIRNDVALLLGGIRPPTPPPEIGVQSFEAGRPGLLERVTSGLGKLATGSDRVDATNGMHGVATVQGGDVAVGIRLVAMSLDLLKLTYDLRGTGLTGLRFLVGWSDKAPDNTIVPGYTNSGNG